MKATNIIRFISILVAQQIMFSVDEVHGASYQEAFKALSNATNSIIADGIYLRIWASKNSFVNDIVTESLSKLLPEVSLKDVKYNAPYENEDTDEWMYIIKIEN